ncbi:DnaJ family domain-containing protein [Micromonospora sp. NPDC004704]
MSSWYESRIDRQIREAQERGEFDNLPGAGKPLPDRGTSYHEDWWIKAWIRRENLTGLAPTSLRLRKEAEDLVRTLTGKPSEQAVRDSVADLNERIRRARQGLVDGPPVLLDTFDPDEVVEIWREQRARPGDSASKNGAVGA